jgi:hypothetical protein
MLRQESDHFFYCRIIIHDLKPVLKFIHPSVSLMIELIELADSLSESSSDSENTQTLDPNEASVDYSGQSAD